MRRRGPRMTPRLAAARGIRLKGRLPNGPSNRLRVWQLKRRSARPVPCPAPAGHRPQGDLSKPPQGTKSIRDR